MIIKCVLRLIRSITMTTSSCEKGSLYVWRALWTISSLQKFRLTTKFLMERNNQYIPMFHECSTFCLPPKMRQFLEDSVWIRSSAWFVWNEILQMCILNDDYKKTIVSDTKASNVNPVERRITVLSVCVLLGKGKRPWPYESVWIKVKKMFRNSLMLFKVFVRATIGNTRNHVHTLSKINVHWLIIWLIRSEWDGWEYIIWSPCKRAQFTCVSDVFWRWLSVSLQLFYGVENDGDCLLLKINNCVKHSRGVLEETGGGCTWARTGSARTERAWKANNWSCQSKVQSISPISADTGLAKWLSIRVKDPYIHAGCYWRILFSDARVVLLKLLLASLSYG